MIELLAVGSAVLYGSADFFGGLTARRANTIATVFVSQGVGLVLLLLVLPFLPAASVSSRDWVWGFVAGLSGGIGVALLYRALAIGAMALVAPTTAVIAAMIPVLFALVLGERLRMLTWGGVGLALLAIALVSRPAVDDPKAEQSKSRALPPGFGLALLSGEAVGIFFLSLARTTTAAGMWPLVAARIATLILFGAIALIAGRTLLMSRAAAVTAISGGALDMAANALYMTAARVGPLSIVVTLASLYPASTVLLARRVVLGERLSAVQMAGIVCALAAVLIIVGSTG